MQGSKIKYMNLMLVPVSFYRLIDHGIYEEFESVCPNVVKYLRFFYSENQEALNLCGSKLKGWLLNQRAGVALMIYECVKQNMNMLDRSRAENYFV
jgi:hypothetical protein